MIKIAPSILAANPLCLENECEAVAQGGADWLHIDVMDGQYVPNLTFGPHHVKAFKNWGKLPLDVHLMTRNLPLHISSFAQAGADYLTFHPEADPHPYRMIQLIKSYDCKAGIALNPGTSMECVEPLLGLVDLVLVMSVNPGFGGQSFLADQIDKIQRIKEYREQKNYQYVIQVDGGITSETAPLVIAAGADCLVAGTSVFANNQIAQNIHSLRKST